MLEIIKKTGYHPCGRIMVLAKCECGKEFEAIKENIKRGKTRSCGCLRSNYLRDKLTNNHQAMMDLQHSKNKSARNNKMGVKGIARNSKTKYYHFKKVKDGVIHRFHSRDPFETLQAKRDILIRLNLPYSEDDYNQDYENLSEFVASLKQGD